jgi:hypothetical protein
MVRTAIDIPKEKMAALEAIAERDARAKDEVILEALDQYLARRDLQLPDWIGMIRGDDGTLTSDNVDERLRANWHPE